jgi:signal transduction histidine kinase/HAMP domain-containing protein
VISINVLILVAIIVLTSWSSDAALRERALERFERKNDEVASELSLDLDQLIDQSNNLVTTLTAGDMDNATDLRSEIINFVEQTENPLVQRLSLMLPDGSVGSLRLDEPGQVEDYRWRPFTQINAIPDEPVFNQAMSDGDIAWMRQEAPYFDRVARPTVSLVIPYSHDSGDGVLWLDIPQANLQQYAASILNDKGLLTDTENGYALLLDASNQPLTAHNLPVGFADVPLAVQQVQQRMDYNTGSVGGLKRADDPFYEDNQALFSVDALPVNNDWTFVSTLPVNEIPRLPAAIFTPIVVVAVLGVMALIFALSQFIEQAVVRPLVDLGRSASEIGEGNMRFIVFHQDKEDEIGRLANAMEQMRVRLKESYDELQRWSRTLEERVDERTHQLTIAQQRAETNAEQLRAVYDESISVVNEARLQPVLDAFIERILTLLDATYCAVWLLTKDGERLQLLATNDERRSHSNHTISISREEGMAGQAVRTSEPVMVNDYREFQNRIDLDSYYDRPKAPFVRGMCVPLLFGGETIGAAIAGRAEGTAPFDIHEQRQLTLFANLVAPSVRNAQLFVQLNAAVTEAERANQVKTRFLASVTHELRTPLNLIINNMDFMRVGTFGEVNDEQVKRLNQTVRSAEHLLYLINDLLDVSKIEAGEMQLFIQQTDIHVMLDDAIDNALALLDSYEDKDNVDFITEIEDDLPDIPMDARRIRQVLNNLLSNAIKFTAEGHIKLEVMQADNGVHFSVEDTGLGIPEDEIDLLFAAFERTTAAKQKNIEGTGLGLPISRYLVRQHGGDLVVRSTDGEGSTFAFTLPFEQSEQSDTPSMTDTQQINAVLSSKRQTGQLSDRI